MRSRHCWTRLDSTEDNDATPSELRIRASSAGSTKWWLGGREWKVNFDRYLLNCSCSHETTWHCRMAEELKNKISSLKSLTIDIGEFSLISHVITRWVANWIVLGNEVRYQDKILNDLDDDMGRTGGFMQNTVGRVMRLRKNKKSFTCYMLLFALLIFCILYVVLKLR